MSVTYQEYIQYPVECTYNTLVWKNRPKVRRKNSLVRLEKMAAHTHCKKTKINHGADRSQMGFKLRFTNRLLDGYFRVL